MGVVVWNWVPDLWNYLSALESGAWAAIAAWATFGVAVIAAILALRQVREARLTRDEQAQPNVVIYSEPHAVHWPYLELVVKNFGATPAYDVEMSFSPEPVVTPHRNLATGDWVTHLAYPKQIPFLAPGQEWRTLWDSGKRRADHKQKHPDEPLASRFDAAARYRDSRRRPFETRSVLDWQMLEPTTQIPTKTAHHIAKTLDEQLKKSNKQLAEIVKALDAFTDEHSGFWVYPVDATSERNYREAKAVSDAEDARKRMEQLRAVGDEIRREATTTDSPQPDPTSDRP